MLADGIFFLPYTITVEFENNIQHLFELTDFNIFRCCLTVLELNDLYFLTDFIRRPHQMYDSVVDLFLLLSKIVQLLIECMYYLALGGVVDCRLLLGYLFEL
jgi:hypothetical protein